MKKLRNLTLAVLSLAMVLSAGAFSKPQQAEAVTYVAQGTNYQFRDSVISYRTFSGNGSLIKISYNASCDHGVLSAGGYWDVRLQKLVNGVWGDAKQTKDVPCTTYKTVDTLSFGTVTSGTYRIRFNKVTKSGLVTIHSWGAYRA